MNLDAYLDAARAARGLPSDNQLSTALGLKRASVSGFRKGRALPSDETMARIAELAGVNVERALIELNYWRTRNGTARSAYKAILARMGAAVLFGLGVMVAASITGPRPALALNFSWPYSVYYGKNRKPLRRRG